MITHLDGVPRILRNDQPLPASGLGTIRVVGSGMNTEAIGAKVAISGNGPYREIFISRTRSYLSQNTLAIPFISGGRGTVTVSVTFPDGQTTEHSSFDPDGEILIRNLDRPGD